MLWLKEDHLNLLEPVISRTASGFQKCLNICINNKHTQYIGQGRDFYSTAVLTQPPGGTRKEAAQCPRGSCLL